MGPCCRDTKAQPSFAGFISITLSLSSLPIKILLPLCKGESYKHFSQTYYPFLKFILPCQYVLKDKFIKWNSIKFIQIISSNAYSFCIWYSNYLKSCDKTDIIAVNSYTMGKAFFVGNFFWVLFVCFYLLEVWTLFSSFSFDNLKLNWIDGTNIKIILWLWFIGTPAAL